LQRLQPVRGTRDLLPDEYARHRLVAETARSVAERASYREIATPVFEFADVFSRTLGEATDVVTKEMYTFQDRSGDSISLRPENTAGVVRAVISGGLTQTLPLKFFYNGPMFRHERPQKGRLRQFHQIGVELIGIPEPLGDVEVIALGAELLERLGVAGKTRLELNSLGDAASRETYRDVLVAHLNERRASLSEESRERLERNPMRILDSKDQQDRKVIESAPNVLDHLNAESRAFFDSVCRGLAALGIAYELNPRLVRGLDYYCHTAFEFTTETLGAQGAVIAGGRYDGLVEQMGGPATPGVGWAGGIERLAMLLDDGTAGPRPIALIPIGTEAQAMALGLGQRLRAAGFIVDFGYRGNLKKGLRHADRIGACAALLIGEDELARASATLRDLDSGAQETAPFDELEARLERYRPVS
jgi:histidyl-tRNA synthetase